MSVSDSNCFIANNEALPAELGSILTSYILKYEVKIFSKLLGYQLAKEFIAAIDAGSPDQKWLDLANGADYTYGGILKRFDGLKIVSTNYTYNKYIKENLASSTIVGIKRTVSENSEFADPSHKQSYALNEIADINLQLREFIPAINGESPDTYENYISGIFGKVTHFGF